MAVSVGPHNDLSRAHIPSAMEKLLCSSAVAGEGRGRGRGKRQGYLSRKKVMRSAWNYL
jgi:hypothetical protein